MHPREITAQRLRCTRPIMMFCWPSDSRSLPCLPRPHQLSFPLAKRSLRLDNSPTLPSKVYTSQTTVLQFNSLWECDPAAARRLSFERQSGG